MVITIFIVRSRVRYLPSSKMSKQTAMMMALKIWGVSAEALGR